mmetsp:Transcript_27893/g.52176  ORF Transcript_27893/g.52176 Transcript_27893/m.52176 type:complete len:205 (+) Transcript_27893:686-1300(+)
MAHRHVAKGVKLPVLVAMSAEPLAVFVMPFITKAHGDPVIGMGPDLFDEAIAVFPGPFAGQESLHLGATVQEFIPVAPCGVPRIGQRDLCGIAAVPCILGHADLGHRVFEGKRRQGRARGFLLGHSGTLRFSDSPPARAAGRRVRPRPVRSCRCARFRAADRHRRFACPPVPWNAARGSAPGGCGSRSNWDARRSRCGCGAGGS